MEDELAALKGRLAGSPVAGSLPAAAAPQQAVQVQAVDAELEELRRSIDKL